MSDEQRKDEDTEVEAHMPRHPATEEPPAEGDEDDEVEAHIRKANVRMDSPRHI
jgi:hypothetical protein